MRTNTRYDKRFRKNAYFYCSKIFIIRFYYDVKNHSLFRINSSRSDILGGN